MIADREVALRLAVDRDVNRKLTTAARSRFFWAYALSLWDPDAFWKCVGGASAFAFAGLFLAGTMPGVHLATQLTATLVVEYFLVGLILMWAFNLGSWLHPTNLMVIFTFIFRLYRKNLTTGDLSAQEIGRMFPEDPPSTGWRLAPMRVYLGLRRSTPVASLLLGTGLAGMMVAILLMAA